MAPAAPVVYSGAMRFRPVLLMLCMAAALTAAVPPAAASERFVPVVAQVPGADGSYWNTELWVTNLSGGVGTYAITFLPSGEDNTRALVRGGEPVSLGAGETVHVKDVVPPGKAGALRVVASEGVVVTCRLFNAHGRGSVGQIVPALTLDQMIAPGTRAYLVPLVRSAQFRTNVGLFNPGGNPIKVHAQVLDEHGQEVGRAEYSLGPGTQTQINDYLLTFKVTQADGYQVVLTSEGRFAAYASMVDARTGAPTLLLPVFE